MSESSYSAEEEGRAISMFFVVCFAIYMFLGICVAMLLYSYKYYSHGLLAPADNGPVMSAMLLSSTLGTIAASIKMISTSKPGVVRSDTDALVSGIVSLAFGAIFAVPVLILLVLYVMYR